jgi:hypothetical protein
MRKEENEKQFELMQRYRRTAVAVVGKEKKRHLLETKTKIKIETLQDTSMSQKKDTIAIKPIMAHVVKGCPCECCCKIYVTFYFPKKSKLRYENTTLNLCVVHNIVHLDSSYFFASHH